MNITDKHNEVRSPEDEDNSEDSIQQEDEAKNDSIREIKALQDELEDYKGMLLRSRAENENQRKRLEREITNTREFAITDFMSSLLPMKDSIEKGIDLAMEEGADRETLFEGLLSTLKICENAFKAAGAEEIIPTVGNIFDPELEEAMVVKQLENELPNTILSVFEKGYLLNNRLIRSAKVEVSKK